ncbi:MAG: hypothetical protein WCO56_14365 [Verrucomicrobiota bacterium]
MPRTFETPYWKRRRVLWSVGSLLLLGGVATVATLRSRTALIVVYNDTGANLAELTISACGQSQTHRDVGDHESVLMKLKPANTESDIAVFTNGTVMWRGDYVEPRRASRSVVRLQRDGQVECFTTGSWWQDYLVGAATESRSTP